MINFYFSRKSERITPIQEAANEVLLNPGPCHYKFNDHAVRRRTKSIVIDKSKLNRMQLNVKNRPQNDFYEVNNAH